MAANKPCVDMDVMFHLKNAQENFFDTERRQAVDKYFRAEDERLGRTRVPVETREQRRARERAEAKQRGRRKAR